MHDDYRLMFWLSNCVVLRAIISETTVGRTERNGVGKGKKQASSPLKWRESSPGRKENKSFSDWDNPIAFTSALERVETWIFSRIIESVWWQVTHKLFFAHYYMIAWCRMSQIVVWPNYVPYFHIRHSLRICSWRVKRKFIKARALTRVKAMGGYLVQVIKTKWTFH